MHRFIVFTLLLGCGGSAKKTVPPAERPVDGVYEVDKDYLKPRLLAAMTASGFPEDTIRRDMEVLEPGAGWLVLMPKAKPLLVYDVERGGVKEVALTKSREGVELVLDTELKAMCQTPDAVVLDCKINIQGQTLGVRMRRLEAPKAKGLPTPGVYKIAEKNAADRKAGLKKWLGELGLDEPGEADRLIAESEARPRFMLVGSDRVMSVGGHVQFNPNEKKARVELAADAFGLKAAANGFEVKVPGRPPWSCALSKDGFVCDSEFGKQAFARDL